MPKIKVDRIVSFSTEDPIHEACNILSNDPSKKWKCHKEGEKDASIVLQLEKASVISGIDIGNEHSAYVEVLVARSSSASDDYKVLLVMSSFMSPLESRQSTNVNKVRMFTNNEFQSPERDQKWDRIKIVCTQPFNRRVQYGLTFISLHSREGKEDVTSNAQVKLGKFSLRPDSPDSLTTGSLFARRKELADESPVSAAVAIRGASLSSSLNSDSPKCQPRLKQAKMTPSKRELSSNSDTKLARARNRDELLYSKDEEEANEKIDKLIEQKNKETRDKLSKEEEAKNNGKKQKFDKKVAALDDDEQNKNKHQKNNIVDTPSTKAHSSRNRQDASTSKRKKNENTPHTSAKKQKSDKSVKPFNKLLDGVTLVISGIENPERGIIRSNALEMGATYKADWNKDCTHLVCAFTNTPKYNQVRGKGKIINRLWIQDCHSLRKRLPWRRYALDAKEQGGNESEEEICEEKPQPPPKIEVLFTRENRDDDDDDTDTEGEIDRIETLQKAKHKLARSSFSTDTEEENIRPQNKKDPPELPNFLLEKTVYIDPNFSEKSKSLLARYIVSFNGTLVDDPSDAVNFVISLPQTAPILKDICLGAYIVKQDWVWECHNTKQLVPPEDYQL